jgi:alkyl hydroperoxide reductase subunit AhpC
MLIKSWCLTSSDLPVGRSVDETLRLLQAFQFTDEHGEVCPADWDPKKNAATIKATPKDSKAYFASAYENAGAANGAK